MRVRIALPLLSLVAACQMGGISPVGPTATTGTEAADPTTTATSSPAESPPPTTAPTTTDSIVTTTTTAPPTTTTTLPSGVSEPPEWLGTRPLPVDDDGDPVPVPTPPELADRRFTTADVLPPPPDDAFHSSVAPVPPEVEERSTWTDECPVSLEDLAYVTVTFMGFDERPHTGELLVNESVADDMVATFRRLYEAEYPIEEMRIASPADLDAEPTGDGNTTTAFVCRPVTGGANWSEHAYGLAIDINPFHNPYVKGDLVLPELAGAYTDRSREVPGIIHEGGAVTDAFDRIGWGWGGRWSSLKDYQHFSLRNR